MKNRFDSNTTYKNLPGPGSYELDQSSIERRLSTSHNSKRLLLRSRNIKSSKSRPRSKAVDMTFTAGALHSKVMNNEKLDQSLNSFVNERNPRVNRSFSAHKTVGPGDYYKELDWIDRSKILRKQDVYNSMKHNPHMTVYKTVSSIPHRKTKNQLHTGVGNDKPGPDSYQPDVSAVKQTKSHAGFGRATSKRGAFSKALTHVGPGDYNMIHKHKKNFHVTGGSSVFLSRVKRTAFPQNK